MMDEEIMYKLSLIRKEKKEELELITAVMEAVEENRVMKSQIKEEEKK